MASATSANAATRNPEQKIFGEVPTEVKRTQKGNVDCRVDTPHSSQLRQIRCSYLRSTAVMVSKTESTFAYIVATAEYLFIVIRRICYDTVIIHWIF